MFNPGPPQGFSTDQGQTIIGRSPIPLFAPPQGIEGGESSPLPSAPLNLIALTISSTEIDLDWTIPTSEGDSPIVGYQIEEQIGVGPFVIIVADTGNTNTFFNVTGLVTNTDYTYRVSAINGIGIGVPSNTASATTFALPVAPTSLTAMTISSTEIDLDWVAPSFVGGTPIIGYQIERQKEAEGFIIIVADTGNTNVMFNDSGLDVNTLYSYRVAAINAVGVGPVSNIDTNTTFTVPDAPTILVALAISQTEIDLDWVAPSFVGGTPIIGYQIERQKEAEGFIIIVADTGNTNVFFNDTSLDPGTLYSYRVAAINAVGVGDVSNIDSATTIPIPVGMQFEDSDTMVYEIADWFNVLWQQRIPITINASQVPSTQTNFPLLINDVYPDLIGEVEAELRFTDENQILLDYEIQEFDTITGLLIAWVRKPTVSDGDIIYIYYDNPIAVDAQDPNAVYDSNYTSVYHLNGVGTDSTVNAEDFTLFNVSATPAKIGGILFAGDDTSYAIRNPYNIFPSDEITCEFWLQTFTSGEGMVSYAVGSASLANHFLVFAQQALQVFITSTSQNTGLVLNDGALHQITITWENTLGSLLVYVDGIQVFGALGVKVGTTFTNNGALVLGQEQDEQGGGFSDAQALDGILDELKISNIVRSPDYVTTTFNNQDNPGAFYSTGAVQIIPVVTIMGYE